MSTLNQQPSSPSGGSRPTSSKRRRSSSLSSSSSSDVVIILDDHEHTETEEPSKPAPPRQSDPTATTSKGSDVGNNQDDDESKIVEELRRARDELQRHRNLGGADATSGGAVDIAANSEKEIEYIPGLVNRVMAGSNRKGGFKRSVIVTELLVDLVLGFVEPYVMQVSQERTNASNTKKKHGYNNDDGYLCTTPDADSTMYRDRAISWAVARIKDLLRPVDVDLGPDIRIPELDALLSALGRYDGLTHERKVQQRLREVLVRMKPMLSDAKVTKRTDAADTSENDGVPRETATNDGDGEEPTPSPTSIAECWSVSPEKWMEKVVKSRSNETEHSNGAEVTESMNDAMESFPYLRQMKDFLKKRDKKGALNVV